MRGFNDRPLTVEDNPGRDAWSSIDTINVIVTMPTAPAFQPGSRVRLEAE